MFNSPWHWSHSGENLLVSFSLSPSLSLSLSLSHTHTHTHTHTNVHSHTHTSLLLLAIFAFTWHHSHTYFVFLTTFFKMCRFATAWSSTACGRMAAVESLVASSPTWGQCYKTFYDRNLWIFGTCLSACPWQAFPAQSNKQSNLAWKSVNHGPKKFYNIGPWCQS